MKKTLVCLLLLTLCLIPYALSASEVYMDGYWQYQLNDDGTATITKYNGPEDQIITPTTVGGIQVSGLGTNSPVFDTCKSVKWIIVSEGVKEIGYACFRDIPNTNKVGEVPMQPDIYLPSTLERIGEYAFYGNLLAMFVLPESLKSIGNMAFAECEIIILYIPRSVTEMEGLVFGEGNHSAMTIYTEDGSPAYEYAVEHELNRGYRKMEQPELPKYVDSSVPRNLPTLGDEEMYKLRHSPQLEFGADNGLVTVLVIAVLLGMAAIGILMVFRLRGKRGCSDEQHT